MVDGTFAFRLLSLAISLAFGVSSAQSCFTYNCDFEGPCQFETGYTGHRNIRWRAHQGGTPSSGTGPTSGYGGIGSYIFMEASDPVNTGDTTWLSLPAAGYLGEVCLEFAYHMRGEHMGRLDLYTKEGSTSQSNVLWSMQGDQGPNWLAENITVLLPSNNSQITFHGVKGQDYRGDIALDSINVTCGRCGEVAAAPTTTPIDEQPSTVVVMTTDDPASPSVTPDTRTTEDVSSDRPCYRYFCDFETTCDNRTGYDGQNPGIEWRLNNGSTSSARTGPSSGYGGFGSYIYMETSGPDPFDSTWFAIPASGDTGLMCVQFAYHMYGDQMGSLSLLVAEPSLGSQNRVWSMGGNHGNAWMMSRLTVEIPTSRSQLTWIGIRGSGFRSDIALDEILVECGPCNDSTTTPYTTLRPYNTTSPTATTSITSSYVTDEDACSSYFCDFERPCLYNAGLNGTDPSIQWRRHRGGTPSSSTGPTSGYGGLGYYLYMETSGSGRGSTWLTIPASGYIGPVCVAFAYHMHGDQMGSLQLYASDRMFGNGPPLWSVAGNQGNVWWTARVTAIMPTSQARVRWVGIKGSGYRSDIALDMISVQCGACDDSTSSPYTTPRPHFTTTPNYPDTTTTTPSPGLNVSIPDSYVVKRSDSVTVTCFLYVNTACSSNVIFDWVYPSNTQIREHHQGFAMQTFYSLQPSYFFSVLTVTSSNYWLTGVYTCRVSFDGLTFSQRAVIVIYPQGYPQASTTSLPFTTTPNIGGSFTYPTTTSTTYSTSQTPTAGYVQVRLVGRFYYEGRLEVTYNGVWGTVCDDGFTFREATMFCRMLGYSERGEVLSTLLYSPGSGNIWLDEVNCPSTSRQIYDCSHSGWGNHDCTHGEDVGISCSPYITGVYASSTYPPTATPTTPGNIIVRLVDGPSIYEGRLEVRYNGFWGTVCDDSFSYVDAAVFCRMLNYSETGRVLSRSDYRTGSGRIWLDDVECRSNHRHINECSHRPWGVHNCVHSEDVGIGCYPTISNVRLSDGNRSSEGRLEVRYNGEWVRFCGDYFTVNEAAVFCRMLGEGSHGIILDNDTFAQGSGRFLDHYYVCESYNTNITQCRLASRSNHSCHLEAAIRCFNSSDVRVRVVEGNASYEGRMEIQIGEEWGTICQRFYISTYEANVLCRAAMIGEYGVALQNSSFAPGSGRIWYHGLSCPFYARNLSDCQFNQIQSCSHDQDVGIRCFNDTGVSVRLVGGQNMYEGRLEIHFAREWGTVCNSSFTTSDASVMCRMLHFGSHGLPLQAGSFPPGHGRIWLDNLYCPLPAEDITECSSINWGQSYCDHSRDVGIRCFNESDVAVRLVGGRTSSEGRLEVRYGGVWGTVCRYLSTRAASLFCVAAGLGHYGTELYSFPRGNGTIWLSSFTCPPDAQNIFDCSHSGWGSAYCSHSSDAGITCRNAIVCSSLTCANRRQCYYSSDKCDGIADCDDGSDEADCPCLERDGAEFRCSNGRCVSWEVVCDGANDCRDNSDESHNCSSCSIGYFRCDGRCLPQFKRCDGSVDCFDSSDELSCECPDGEFRCGGYCYPARVICQYNIECLSVLSLDCANLSTGPVPCGRPAITRGQSSSFIINGNEATPYSWPWQVSMVKYNIDGYWIHQCGGSLIDPCWVLTAAHCVDADIGSIRIRAGTHDQTGTVPFEETVGFQRVVVHPEYINFHNNDIALIQLSRCLPLSEKIGTICVPTSVVAADTTCTVTGWGRTEGTGDSRVLQEVDVSIMNQTYCRATWPNNNLTQSHLCATGTGVGVCNGDSGGPLVCLRNDRYEVHGIVSFGQPSCTESQRPDVYTRVTSFTPFIRSVIPTEASCANATADSRLLECDFEDGFCNFMNESVANGWRRWAGSTPTSNTGPYRGYNGSRHYAYHESSRATTSRMVTPTLCTASGDSLCLSLCYHMFGSRVVKLSVTVGGKPVMTVSGNQANEWKCRKTFVKSVARHTWVTFLAKSGYNTGDIAIDNVVIQKGSCI